MGSVGRNAGRGVVTASVTPAETRAVPEPGPTATSRRLSRTDVLLSLAIAGVFAFLYGANSILRYMHFESAAFDLGIFGQAVWHLSAFEAPASTIRGYDNLFGDHFHPILALAAPAFWVWDDVRSLLVLQSLVLASSSLAVYWVACRRFGTAAAVAWSTAYLLSWGLIEAARFDFHEIVFAVPLVALACALVVEEKMGAALAPVLALLLVKEDLAFLVAAFGIVYLLRRHWLSGVALIAAGIGWFALATEVIIPALADGRSFPYWNYPAFGDGPGEAVRIIATHPWRLVTEAVDAHNKLSTGFFLLAPFAFLSLLSPLVVLLVPLVAERVFNDNPVFWTRYYHYTATSVPVLAIAAIDGLRRIRDRFGVRDRAIVAISAGLVVLAVLGNYPRLPFEDLARGSRWRLTDSERAGNEILRGISPDAAVIAQDVIAPHVSQRDKVWILPIFLRKEDHGLLPPFRARTADADVVVVNVDLPLYHETPRMLARYLSSLPAQGFVLTRSDGPWLLYEKGQSNAAPLSARARAFFRRYAG